MHAYALPIPLCRRCRELFLESRVFDGTPPSYKAIMVTTELLPYKPGMPTGASSEADCISLCIDYLLSHDVNTDKGRRVPLLVCYVRALRELQSEGNQLREDFDALANELEASFCPSAAMLSQDKEVFLESLRNLDFKKQEGCVREVLKEQRVAAFLVHGPPDCGQQVLVSRLVGLCPTGGQAQRCTIDFGAQGLGVSKNRVWSALASKLEVPGAPPAKLVDKVCQWLVTQSVIFTFHTVNITPPLLLDELLRDFWKPLARQALANLGRTERETHLILFLVDYLGKVHCAPEVRLAQKPCPPDYPSCPLRLPPTKAFPPSELENWFTAMAGRLPADMSAQRLFRECRDRLPDTVYRWVCRHLSLELEWEAWAV